MADLIEATKRAALGAVEASKPVAVLFGTVTAVSPLEINVEQKMTLGQEQLILTKSVTDHTVEMTVDHQTEEALDHRHPYQGKKTFKLHRALKAGEKVILLRVQGGQQFVVWDRVVMP